MTRKLNNDNGLQDWKTEHQAVTTRFSWCPSDKPWKPCWTKPTVAFTGTATKFFTLWSCRRVTYSLSIAWTLQSIPRVTKNDSNLWFLGFFCCFKHIPSPTQDAYAPALRLFLSLVWVKHGGGPLIPNIMMMCIFPVLHIGQAICDCFFTSFAINSIGLPNNPACNPLNLLRFQVLLNIP